VLLARVEPSRATIARSTDMRPVLSLCAALACLLALANAARAQSWSASRARPSLFEIIAVDKVSDALWPFGSEDPAMDGVSTLEADEAAIDLRSVYADARGGRLWLRAYVTAKVTPSANALYYLFIDADMNAQTGGKASDKLWSQLSVDPSSGGYEHAVVLRGDGTLSGFYTWNGAKSVSAWEEATEPSKQLEVESGVARDPLRLSGDDHAYAQVSLPLSAADLDERCLANIFVRSANDGNGKRAFGDQVDSFATTCRPKLNSYGDPEILRGDSCTKDDTCPGAGHCRDGICLFGYECSGDATCQSEQRCVSSACVLVVDRSCTQSVDCDGLVCDAKKCVGCTETGARACASGSVCAPDGRCLRRAGSTGNGNGNGNAGSAANSGIQVRGGAFSCALAAVRGDSAWSSALALTACLGAFWRWRRRRPGRQPRKRGEA
jgi:hypothetical protein